jgi:hypothetical protein
MRAEQHSPSLRGNSTRSEGCHASARRQFFSNNSHGNTGDPAYDFSMGRKIESPNLLLGMGVGNDHELAPIDLTSAADITVPQFHEIDRAIEFRRPFFRANFLLGSVDLHKRARANEGVGSVVFEANVAVHRFVQTEML